MLSFTDTHCHLNFNTFESDLPETLDRAQQAGVDRILVPAIDLPGSRAVVALCDRFPNLFAAVGIHPNVGLTMTDDTLRVLEELAQHPKVVAIGEIGLDYYRNETPGDLQKMALIRQLELAGELGLPVILHNRAAFQDLWEILSNWQKELKTTRPGLFKHPGVFHSFSEDVDKMNLVISHNFYIGISGPVTYKNGLKNQAVAAAIPAGHLLLETDSPFLPPHPYRGQRNEPANIKIIAEKISQLRNEDITLLSSNTQNNADLLFSWRKLI